MSKNIENRSIVKLAKIAQIFLYISILYFFILLTYISYKFLILFLNPDLEINLFKIIYYSISLIACLCFVFIFLILTRSKIETKINYSLFFIVSIFCILLIEFYYEINRPDYDFARDQRKFLAHQNSISFDERTRIEVFKEINKKNQIAFPDLIPNHLSDTNGLNGSNKDRIFPFGSISNSKTILENELGFYPVIDLDEYGFNNPKNQYHDYLDIALVGDSFFAGYSVNASETIGSNLRAKDLNVLTLAKAGNGPLIELALIREYITNLKPKVIIWGYHTNDLGDLETELNSEILFDYLNNRSFTQNLMAKQKEIDILLKAYSTMQNEKFNREIKIATRKKILNNRIFRIMKLSNIRARLNLLLESQNEYQINEEILYEHFHDILLTAKSEISEWDGHLYFVYLPSHHRYTSLKDDSFKNQVIKIVKSLDIPIIDIHEEVFNVHPDPLSLFPFRIASHYSPEGYYLVSEAIFLRLSNDKLLNLR